MTNLPQRAITGILLATVIFLSIIYGIYSFTLLIILINVLGLLEFYRLYLPYTHSPRNIMGTLLSISILVTFIIVIAGKGDWRILLANIPLAFGILVTELYLKSPEPIHSLALIFLGILCVTLPLAFFIAVCVLPLGVGNYPYIALGYFFILWSNDSGAYFVGKYIGKRALFPRLSPKKTWEGSLGGATCALLVALILGTYFSNIGWVEWLFIALIIIVTGTFGDLHKSLMKRSLHIKDSGTILPGHGGILDRFDTLLGSAPFVFCYLSLLAHA